MTGRFFPKKVKIFIDILLGKKAENMMLLDLRKYNGFTDWFLIATSQNIKHSQSLAELINKEAGTKGYKVRNIEGKGDGKWVVMDYNDIIIHIFIQETRMLYSLDRIWSGAGVYKEPWTFME
ncbi:ribosome silencing factor [bacterium Unc6]|nr:ribosome silencing factor [bacterium Unc6]